MSLQDTVFDLEESINEKFGKGSVESKWFDEIIDRLWAYEAEYDNAIVQVNKIRAFRDLLNEI